MIKYSICIIILIVVGCASVECSRPPFAEICRVPLPAPAQPAATAPALPTASELPEYEHPGGNLFALPETCDPQTGCDAGSPDGDTLAPAPDTASASRLPEGAALKTFRLTTGAEVEAVDLDTGNGVLLHLMPGNVILVPAIPVAPPAGGQPTPAASLDA